MARAFPTNDPRTEAAPWQASWTAVGRADGDDITATSGGSPVELKKGLLVSADLLKCAVGSALATATSVTWQLIVTDPRLPESAGSAPFGPVVAVLQGTSVPLAAPGRGVDPSGAVAVAVLHVDSTGNQLTFDIRGLQLDSHHRTFLSVVAVGGVDGDCYLFEIQPVYCRPI